MAAVGLLSSRGSSRQGPSPPERRDLWPERRGGPRRCGLSTELDAGAAAPDPLVGVAAAVAAWAARRPDLGARTMAAAGSTRPLRQRRSAPHLCGVYGGARGGLRRAWVVVCGSWCGSARLRMVRLTAATLAGLPGWFVVAPIQWWRCGCAGGVWASGVRAGGAAIFVIVVRLRVCVKASLALVKT
jgi:hypothetical protein